jgi:hypothetical protein
VTGKRMKKIMADQPNNKDNIMKKVQITEQYSRPEIEMIQVEVEGVLAQSLGDGEAGGGTEDDGWG